MKNETHKKRIAKVAERLSLSVEDATPQEFKKAFNVAGPGTVTFTAPNGCAFTVNLTPEELAATAPRE